MTIQSNLPTIKKTDEQIKNLVTQLHPIHLLKKDIWVQIDKSYTGGVIYKNAEPNYLHKFSLRENETSYMERKKRAVYFNNTKPLSNMLVGFLYGTEPTRSEYNLKYIYEKADGVNSLNVVSRRIALKSLLMPCGVLVDSPKFNPNDVQTEGDRQIQGLNPYVVLYKPWQIRNFYFEGNVLKWLLLDNSIYNNSDPFKPASLTISLRLWTPELFQDFVYDIPMTNQEGGSANQNYVNALKNIYAGNFEYKVGEEKENPCGIIPFRFQNWEDKDNDKLPDSNFEDMVLYDQAVYNYMSLMDEMLSGGVFKWLFYPGDLPKTIESEGFAHLSTISYDPTATHEPKFDGPSLNDVEPFINAINFYLIGAKRNFGLDTDQDKDYVQSGAAKKFDFTKVKALLHSGAMSMEDCEKDIFKFAGLWEGKKDETIKVEYKRDFLGEEQQDELNRLFQVMTLPYREIKRQAGRRIAALNFNDILDQDEIDAINDDIDKTEMKPEPREKLTPEQMAEMEKKSRAAKEAQNTDEQNIGENKTTGE